MDNLADKSKVAVTQLVSNILFFHDKQYQTGKKTPLELKTSLTNWSWNKIQSITTKKNDPQSKDKQNVNMWNLLSYAKDIIDVTVCTTLKLPTYDTKN